MHHPPTPTPTPPPPIFCYRARTGWRDVFSVRRLLQENGNGDSLDQTVGTGTDTGTDTGTGTGTGNGNGDSTGLGFGAQQQQEEDEPSTPTCGSNEELVGDGQNSNYCRQDQEIYTCQDGETYEDCAATDATGYFCCSGAGAAPPQAQETTTTPEGTLCNSSSSTCIVPSCSCGSFLPAEIMSFGCLPTSRPTLQLLMYCGLQVLTVKKTPATISLLIPMRSHQRPSKHPALSRHQPQRPSLKPMQLLLLQKASVQCLRELTTPVSWNCCVIRLYYTPPAAILMSMQLPLIPLDNSLMVSESPDVGVFLYHFIIIISVLHLQKL
jgi:hypothetical protein